MIVNNPGGGSHGVRVVKRLRRFVRRMVIAGVLVLWLVYGVDWSPRPPRNPDDICAIFTERRSWYLSARRSYERWGVPETVQLAVIHQESSFKATARAPRRKIFWIFPGPRRSSARGYGQALNRTWREYQRGTGNGRADRSDFAAVTDFIGWYGQRAHRLASVPKSDAYRFYLAYHEGANGYRRGTWRNKPRLQAAAKKVAARAGRYQKQYIGCRQRLSSYRWWWPF